MTAWRRAARRRPAGDEIVQRLVEGAPLALPRRRSELGHVPTFTTPLRHVWKAAITRHSAPNVGKAAMIGPSSSGR